METLLRTSCCHSSSVGFATDSWILGFAALSLLSAFTQVTGAYPCDEEGAVCGTVKGKVCRGHECICDLSIGLIGNEEYQDCNLLTGWHCGYHDDDYECVPNAECSNLTNTCECEQGFTSDENGECRRGYLQSCDENILCHVFAYLNCDRADNTCRCSDPLNMMYDPEKQSCVSMLGKFCDLKPGIWLNITRGCVTHAKCAADSSIEDANHFGVCKCEHGYSPDAQRRRCVRGFREPCNTHSDCVTNYCFQQSLIRGCDCTPGAEFDVSINQCRILPGRPCHPQASFLENVSHQMQVWNYPCAENSHCDSNTYTCECIEGHVNDGEKCVPSSSTSPSPEMHTSKSAASVQQTFVIAPVLFSILRAFLPN